MSLIETDVFRWLKANPFYQHLGFELLSDQEINLKLVIKQDLLNTNKTLHGGVHASMLDMVQTILLRSLYQSHVIATNQDIHYFAPSRSGELFAKAKVLQKGYKIATTEAEIIDENKKVIAKGTGIYRIKRLD
ncbi:PaaI family thioesterase [Bacillus sp. BRMEA1]|uniref:PaaI family thioesterase n=1 Tax=Neobacillus endophyticus TaxID=2738405 RepID=UPI001566687A|nr:PaaI family thioesterase [Neobacillus endophyticus]NRD79344.1 PaaI family thioesterase [Neobacillus endophyticus]